MNDNDKPFTQADVDRVLELFETKYPDLYARYVQQVQTQPEYTIVDVFFGKYEEPACHLILDVILKEGFKFDSTITYTKLMIAVQDVLLRRLGLWYS